MYGRKGGEIKWRENGLEIVSFVTLVSTTFMKVEK